MFIKFYFWILPFYLAFGTILQGVRISGVFEDFAPYYFGLWLFFDLLLLFSIHPRISGRSGFVIFLCLISFGIGLAGNGINRHTFTDFVTVVVFFLKIDVMRALLLSRRWDIGAYTERFVRLTTSLCLPALILAWFVVMRSVRQRMAIAPPLEVAFSFFLYHMRYMSASLVLFEIIGFGQRAMLLGSFCIATYLLRFLSLKKKIVVILCFVSLGAGALYLFSETPVVQRIVRTANVSTEDMDDLNAVSAGRLKEVSCALESIDTWQDFVFGRGCGMSFYSSPRDKYLYQTHFSPLCFVLKYGLTFAIYLYLFLFTTAVGAFSKKTLAESIPGKEADLPRIFALAILFFLVESLFSYMLLTSIAPFLLGYILYHGERCQPELSKTEI